MTARSCGFDSHLGHQPSLAFGEATAWRAILDYGYGVNNMKMDLATAWRAILDYGYGVNNMKMDLATAWRAILDYGYGVNSMKMDLATAWHALFGVNTINDGADSMKMDLDVKEGKVPCFG